MPFYGVHTRFEAPFKAALHSGSASGWSENVAAVPEAGLPTLSAGHGNGNEREMSRRWRCD